MSFTAPKRHSSRPLDINSQIYHKSVAFAPYLDTVSYHKPLASPPGLLQVPISSSIVLFPRPHLLQSAMNITVAFLEFICVLCYPSAIKLPILYSLKNVTLFYSKAKMYYHTILPLQIAHDLKRILYSSWSQFPLCISLLFLYDFAHTIFSAFRFLSRGLALS